MEKSLDGWQLFTRLCCQIKTQKELSQLFDLFLTCEEKKDLAKRALIIQALLQQLHPQREIAKQLQVSYSKITRGSNALKIINLNLKELLKEALKE